MSKVKFKTQSGNCKIAVVGLGCYYPGARSPLQLWENILARRRQFREMPDVRLPNADYYDPDPTIPDKTYQNKAAVMDGYQFDWLEKRIPKQTYESTDIVHWLALDTALQAITDAGYSKDLIPKEKTGVILGNTLTGEFTRSNQMLLRWPYVRKALRASAKQKGLSHIIDDLEISMEEHYKSVFAPVTEDTLAGGLANTIAGRICNFLDIHGGGYIVDGACSSSLLAIVTAANYLELGQMDTVIAGGVDVSLDTFELIGFAKTGALTPDEMRVYDKDGKGFLPGEGCGMVVLRRLEDAIKDNNQVYAVINGWGISSDGKGGITAPSAVGQSRALIRAFEKAKLNPDKLDFIEGHGTGTTVGDKVELEGISIALSTSEKVIPRNCGVTSFKSIVGHTKAAAGIGAFIKAVMAVNRRILPPTAGLKDPNPIFDGKATALYPITQGITKDPDSIINAGISAMGFGGINSHVVIQSGGHPAKQLNSAIDEAKLMVSNQSHELFLFAAKTTDELAESVNHMIDMVKGISYAEMADLAFLSNSKIDFSLPIRAAIIADTPLDFNRKLNVLNTKLKDWNKQFIGLENNSIIAGFKSDDPKMGAVFPGQGSQKINMAHKLCVRHDWLMETVKKAGEIFKEEDAGNVLSCIFRQKQKASDKEQVLAWQDELKQTNVAQPAIILASVIWYEYLTRLGIKVNCVSGHSLGELMAFYVSGLLDMDSLFRFAVFRGKSMQQNGSGSMASLQCSKETAEKYINVTPGYVTIANLNGPQQTIISGEEEGIRQVIDLARKDQVGTVELPVSAAFHSKLVAEVGKSIAQYEVLKQKSVSNSDIKLISSTNGIEILPETDLNDYFANQTTNQVDFISTIDTMQKHCNMILEIGPGKVLSGLISNITADVKGFPVESNPDDDLSFNVLLGNAFVMGSNVNIKVLYEDRLIRDFVPAHQKTFLVNPLERAFPEYLLQKSNGQFIGFEKLTGLTVQDEDFSNYMKVRGGFIKEVIDADYKYFTTHEAPVIRPIISDSENVKTKPETRTSLNTKSTDIRGILYEKLEALTGFSPSGYKDNMKLLDDFNLDSIKSGALLSGIAKALHVTGKVNTSVLSNASLHEIIAAIGDVAKVDIKDTRVLNPEVPKSSEDVATVVFEMLAERTGFPADTLQPGYKLLDDLNLDSIKAGAFIIELLKKYNIRGKIEAHKLANARVEEIIASITDLIETETELQQVTTVQNDYVTYWVNSHMVSLVEEPLQGPDFFKAYWSDRSLVLIYSEDDEKYALELTGYLKSYLSKVIGVSDKNLHLFTSFENSGLVVLVPEDLVSKTSVRKVVDLFTTVAANLGEAKFLGFVQKGNGNFLRDNNIQNSVNAGYSAVSFAASIHHERPDVKIRVIETANPTTERHIAEMILKEFTTDQAFDATGYDKDYIRRKMKYDQAHTGFAGTSITVFDKDDVLLATGGAKGITAECVISFAGKHGCKTALIGSSPLNDEIRAVLSRYEKEHLVARYYSCDISNSQELNKVTERIQQDLGIITVVIHGAGKNVPRRAEQVTADAAMDEISPKLLGAMNLCDVLKDNKLKSFIALTSIIGVTGMPGNSWYAFSNESLDLFLRQYGSEQNINIRTIAYSIWDEVGMGARMGSNRVLADMGIGSISPALGTEQFVKWTENQSGDQQVVISSKMGGLDTWYLNSQTEPQAKRYISSINLFEPGREIVTRVILNRSTDLYLDDHNYNGSLLFPTVFGIEAMAQAACMLAGINHPAGITFENVSLLKPIVVPHTGETEIEIKATIMDGNADRVRIYTGISTEHSGFSSFHFSAEIILNTQMQYESSTDEMPATYLKISPKTDLYSWLLFQGPTFQHIKKVFSLASDHVALLTESSGENPEEKCFAETVRSPLLLGSPLFRDVLLQSVQIFLTGKKYLPVTIKRWKIANTHQITGGTIISRLKEHNEESEICDVEYIVEGKVVEKIEGYEVKALEPTPHYPHPESLADLQFLFSKAIDTEFNKYQTLAEKRILYRIYKADEEFNSIDPLLRRGIEDRVFEEMIPELDVQGISLPRESKLIRAANGKPSVDNSNLKLSISHSGSVLLMTFGMDEQGCDVEFIESRSRVEWDDLLDNKYSGILNEMIRTDNDLNIAATRIWCVRESLIKSYGLIPLNLSIEKIHEDGIVFKAKNGDNDIFVLTFPVALLPSNLVMISTIISLKKTPIKESKPTEANSMHTASFDWNSGSFAHSFITTFKDCKGFYGKTHFTNYPDWMGTLRELVLAPIGNELLKDLGSGQFGMVTNASNLKILNDADTLSKITGNLWITEKSDLENSFIDLNFEFIKTHPETGSLLKLAECNLSTTWVTIEGRGIVKKSPIPEYFLDFLTKHISKKERIDKLVNSTSYPAMSEMGKAVYENKNAIRPQILIVEKEFQTGISNGNTVGNLYYSNYYSWQSKILEQVLFQICPEVMTDNGRSGEFLTLAGNVQHLQEAMPFESIVVMMYLDKVFENGMTFFFEYFSKHGKEKRKLAYGSNSIIWCRRLFENSAPEVQQLPQDIAEAVFCLTSLGLELEKM